QATRLRHSRRALKVAHPGQRCLNTSRLSVASADPVRACKEKDTTLIKYIVRRTLGWLAMIVVATNITFFLAWGFLDPRNNYVGRRPPLGYDEITKILEPRNLSDTIPIWERWWHWLSGVVFRWDWGVSPTGGSVNEQLAYRMWVSAELVLGATIIATVLGIALGVYTASRQYKLADRIGQATSIVTMNINIIVAGFGI